MPLFVADRCPLLVNVLIGLVHIPHVPVVALIVQGMGTYIFILFFAAEYFSTFLIGNFRYFCKEIKNTALTFHSTINVSDDL